ncbi:glycosyltransferase [Acidithiobacillus thiooxidans]|uniref:glycosyltransferase n=1 Tax=Acidithiobacillus thiooxidans TaxID=930 RepID=UPI001C07B6E9|nr:glycosyltransferase [Acidithiobacillus thiooxidans]MBU2839939.1 glycosyltransferase [Acidithiobacillus thiooxidans]
MIEFKIDDYNYIEPWNIPFEIRLKSLLSGELKIAYFYEQPNNSTFRYRAFNMSEALNLETEGFVSASFFFLFDLAESRSIVESADFLVVCRSRYSLELDCLIRRFQSQRKKVFFDIDDLVFNINCINVLLDTLDFDLRSTQTLDEWFAYVGRIGKTMMMCDGVITTNSFLAEQIIEYSKLPVAVIPNFLNRAQQQFSSEITSAKNRGDFTSDGRRSIGYFSGSPSHKLDFKIVVPALCSLLNEDDSIDLVIAGYIDPDISLLQFSNRIKYFPFRDYINLQKLIASVDINLVPLQDNVFTNCKSDLKYFEAGIVGVPSVASPVFSYRSSICHEKNGYLALSYQWEKTIRNALDNSTSSSEIAEQAHIHSLNVYSWNAQTSTIINTLLAF